MNTQKVSLPASISNEIINYARYVLVYLTPIFYFLVAVSFYLRTYDSAQIKITIVQIGGAILLAMFLSKVIEENSWQFFVKNNIFILPLLAFLLSGIISFFRSPLVWASGFELIRRVVYFTLAMVILKEFNDKKKINRLINWILAATFVSTSYGIIQFLDTRYFPPNPEPGLDPFIWRGAFGPRIFSTFGNPNFYGDFLAVVGPIVLTLFFKTRKPFLFVLWLMTTFNVMVTQSKGAWIGYAAGFIIFVALGLRYFMSRYPKLRKFLSWSVLVILVVVSFYVYKFSRARLDSIKFRVYTWLSCWEMINTNPLLGTGIGTFYVTYPAWRRPQIFFIEGKHNTQSDHPENEYLEVWFDEGTIGFGIFLWLLCVFIIGGLKAIRVFSNIDRPGYQPDARAYYLWGLLSALGGMLVHNTVCVSLRFVSSGVMLWFLIGLIGAFVVHNPLPEDAINPLPSCNIIPKIFRRFIQLVIVVAMVWGIKIFYGYFMADIYHNIAIFYSKQGNWLPALEHYTKVVKNNPGFIMTHYFMGNVYNDRWQQDDPLRAIEKYEDVWKLAPNYVQSHHQAGLIYLKWGDDERRRAIAARQSGDIVASQLHEKNMKELWEKAIRRFERYHAIDPIFPANYHRLAWIYIQMNEFDKAEETYYRHLYTKDALFKPGYSEKKWVSEQLGRPVTSIPDWCKNHDGIYHSFYWEDWGRRRNHEYSETYLNLGNLKHLQNDLKKAVEYYKKAVELNPNNTQALKNLAVTYNRLGRQQDAIQVWLKLREISPQDEDVRRVFGGQ